MYMYPHSHYSILGIPFSLFHSQYSILIIPFSILDSYTLMSDTLILTFNRCSVLLSDGVMNNAAIAESILLVCPRATTKLIRHDKAIDESLSTDGEESDTIFIRSSKSVAVGREKGGEGGRKEREGENDNKIKFVIYHTCTCILCAQNLEN